MPGSGDFSRSRLDFFPAVFAAIADFFFFDFDFDFAVLPADFFAADLEALAAAASCRFDLEEAEAFFFALPLRDELFRFALAESAVVSFFFEDAFFRPLCPEDFDLECGDLSGAGDSCSARALRNSARLCFSSALS